MIRWLSCVALAALFAFPASTQSNSDANDPRQACIASLSSFAVDPKVAQKPQLPDDWNGVSLELFSSGCYGTCPSFTLRIERNRAVWEGRQDVRKKGKKEKRISTQTFRKFVDEWINLGIYAMREHYCQPTCPDGKTLYISKVNETSISLKTPSYEKTITECFTAVDGNPQQPKPPSQYFQLSDDLKEFAKSKGWL